MPNRIILNNVSYHGKGAIQAIPDEVRARGFKKAFVCSDPDLVKFNVTKKVTDLLDANNLEYVIYSNIKPNPEYIGAKKAKLPVSITFPIYGVINAPP